MKTVEKVAGPTPEPTLHLPSWARLGSPKIQQTHLERLSAVYLRQSSPQQVLENRESTARQYALADLAVVLGWPRERGLIIDEDLGKSGRSTECRSGFQRLIREVTLGHVGIVFGLELSRLARSSQDWHAFFEMCAVFQTLIADEDGIYDSNDANDRLLLGLKGIMSEMELHIMRNRLDHGRLNKARRGELFFGVPLGYVLLPGSKVALEPDEQARSVVHLLFDKFEELGSAAALFHWLVAHEVLLPVRPRRGAHKGQLEWRRPCLGTILETLHHPIYAGAYTYGRCTTRAVRPYGKESKRSCKRLAIDQWEVLIRDRLPAYITWDRFLKNQQQLERNQSRRHTPGVPRRGCALLGGLVFCGHCGWRMQANYHAKDKAYYVCAHQRQTARDKGCVSVSATMLDELVGRQVLCALEPAGLELSRRAQADQRRERERVNQQWKLKLQRARYDVELAERRYQAVDPENRLVASSLERALEEALRCERALKEEFARDEKRGIPQLSADEEARIASLSSDIPAIWNAPGTTNADRQAVIRCLVERVVIHAEHGTEQAQASIRWAGGYESRLAYARPVRCYRQRSDFEQIKNRILELRTAGKTAEEIAQVLRQECFQPLRQGSSFNQDVVHHLLVKMGLRGEGSDEAQLGRHEWWLRDLARKMGMSWHTLHGWATKGWLHGRQTKVEKRWIIWADAEELARLRKLRAAHWRKSFGKPEELTTPKSRPAGQPAASRTKTAPGK
jgi:DNA invertase Pin-like site-specific DNA recombinase